MGRRFVATMVGAGIGAGAAWLPLVARADGGGVAQPTSRALSAPHDVASVALITLLTLAGILLTATLGYLYRRERHLDWAFQRPDAPHDASQNAHH